jgi:hypothetical protein
MDTLIQIGRGPVFRFAVAIAVLGIARYVLLGVLGFRRARRRAGDGRVAIGALVLRSLQALSPARYLLGNRAAYTACSVAFHAGVLIVPVLAAGHLRLWARGLGIRSLLPALPGAIADVLTVSTVITGALLLVGRAWNPASRSLSRVQDWALPALIVLAFTSGFLLAHPAATPLGSRSILLLHVATGDLLLLLTPFTKIAHCATLPFSQLVNEMAWRFVPGAGHEVTKTLGKEGQPI